VKHPEHVRDVARAFAWAHVHIGHYGGDPGQLFLLGHSAGGHLVALLATDERYLAAEGRTTQDIMGVIAVSGVYRIPRKVRSAGRRWSRRLPGRSDVPAWRQRQERRRLCSPAYLCPCNLRLAGADPVRAEASPVNHVRKDLLPFSSWAPAVPAHAGADGRGVSTARWRTRCADFSVPGRNHVLILFNAVQVVIRYAGHREFIKKRENSEAGRAADQVSTL
jgi:acetyl esterase/lipase